MERTVLVDEVKINLLGLFLILLASSQVECQVTICAGDVYGEATPSAKADDVDPPTGQGYNYLFTDGAVTIGCCGVLEQFQYFSGSTGVCVFQVFRPGGTSQQYTVLGDTSVTIGAADTSYTTAPATPISVESGDLFGVHCSDSDVIRYKQGPVEINGTLQLNLGSAPAVGDTVDFNAATPQDQRTYAIGIIAGANNAPTFDGTLDFTLPSIYDDTAVGTSLYTIAVTDPDADDVAGLTLSMLTSSTLFSFDPATGEVTTAAAVPEGSYDLDFQVCDHCDECATGTLTIPVINKGPNITSLPLAEDVLEGEIAYRELHTLVVSDPTVGDIVTCSMSPTTGHPFSFGLKGSTSDYIIWFNNADTQYTNGLDYATTKIYLLDITCTDLSGNTDTKTFEVNIVDNLAPYFDSALAPNPVPADTTASGALVYTIPATDDEGDDITYAMTCSPDAFGVFTINADTGEVKTAKDMNKHKTTPYDCTVTLTDPKNEANPTTSTMQLVVTNINTPPEVSNIPQDLPLYAEGFVEENQPAGTTVYDVDYTDAEGDGVTFYAVFDPGEGSTLFDFNTADGVFTTTRELDYETDTQTIYYAEVTVCDDRDECGTTKRVRLSIDDVNEDPVFLKDVYAITAVEGSVPEGSSAGIQLDDPMLTVDDPDFSDGCTYSMTGCPDVSIHPTTGLLTQTAEHDLDRPGAETEVVTCTVTCEDYGNPTLTDTTTIEITWIEHNDNPPVFDQGSYEGTFTNNTSAFACLIDVNTADDDYLDEHKLHTYEIIGNSNFGVTNEGCIYSKDPLSIYNPPSSSHSFRIRATDNDGVLQSEKPVTINVVEYTPPVTTTTQATATPASSYKAINSFFDDIGNLLWFIPAMILAAIAAGLLFYGLYLCCNSGLCSRLCGNCGNGNCFGRSHGRGRFGNGPARTSPMTGQKRPPPPQQKNNRCCDCFKRPPNKPKPDDTPWEPWKDKDFRTKIWMK